MQPSLAVFEQSFDIDSSKLYWKGTHRTLDPARTVEKALRHASTFGITRVANVTGLDTIGIPVIMVVRPNSRSLSVSQGKGLTVDAAKASGIMESIELYHAEHIDLPVQYCSLRTMKHRDRVVDVELLARPNATPLSDDLPILWLEGFDLLQWKTVYVPYESVYNNCTIPLAPGHGSFSLNSNGLASGNNVLEALSHAISEVVERDATTLAALSPDPLRKVDHTTVDDPDCRYVLEVYQRAGIEVIINDVTSDVGVPSFDCVILDPSRRSTVHHHRAGGHGCHLDKNIALLRALTEAAQSRLTLITGSRDDIGRRSYQRGIDPWAKRPDELAPATRDFRDIVSLATDSMIDDVKTHLERLRSAGISSVVAVNLAGPDFPFSVVRVVIPGLETMHTAVGYRPGPRARAFAKDGAA